MILDYYLQGYNGFWDGIWAMSLIALAQLQITNEPGPRAEFMRGWNEASKENELWKSKEK